MKITNQLNELVIKMHDTARSTKDIAPEVSARLRILADKINKINNEYKSLGVNLTKER